MKKILLIIASVAVSLTVGAQSSSKYDVNGDGSVNAADIVAIVDYIMGNIEETKTPANAVAVDLGLPTGTKWANMNVGAEKPEDYGLFFAWGETKGYTSVGESSLINGYYYTMTDHLFDWDNYKWCNGSWVTMTKYCTDDNYGTVDNKNILDLEDDAAFMNWGEQWRMPTIDEIQELLANTTAEWTALNDVYGLKFTASNGNYIFLPAAGYRDSAILYNQSSVGNYWSASLNVSGPHSAHYLNFFNSGHGANKFTDCYSRSHGQMIRPVFNN